MPVGGCVPVTDGRFRIVLESNLSEITRLRLQLECFADKHGLPKKTLFELNLILEEILANVISYAYDDDLGHEIAVGIDLRNGEITLVVEDDGKAFNPLLVPPPPADQPLQSMQVGGLGLHLIRKLTGNIAYDRAGGMNRLTIRKTAQSAPA